MVTAECAPSFLGFDVQPPMLSCGRMLGEGQRYLATAGWMTAFPGPVIALSVLGINFIGEGLCDVLIYR